MLNIIKIIITGAEAKNTNGLYYCCDSSLASFAILAFLARGLLLFLRGNPWKSV